MHKCVICGNDTPNEVIIGDLSIHLCSLKSCSDSFISKISGDLPNHPYKTNENHFIRTVTFHYTGKLIAVYPQEIVLSNAAWIPEDGRFADALKSGNFSEVEPYPCDEDVIIGRGAIIDASVFNHTLPTVQK